MSKLTKCCMFRNQSIKMFNVQSKFPSIPREQTSRIELSLFFLTKFANRVAVLVHTHNKRVYIDTPLLEYYQRDVRILCLK